MLSAKMIRRIWCDSTVTRVDERDDIITFVGKIIGYKGVPSIIS